MPSNARKVKCPYCNFKNTKEKVIAHIDKKHEDLIPEGYTAARVLFNSIHHIDHGTCVVCKQPTEWNENTNKYKRLCNNPKCREKLREMYKKNMMKVYGKTTLLNDANQQKKMLANRGISGVYTFQNGKLKEYTGSYEKKMLEFLDKIMGFDPDDIIMPGPTIDYVYKGEHHKWITDALIVPYNLVIEVKDGGDNPNKRVMTTYREKQIAKEEMITNMGTYNYIRLTNNQFEQLIEILYELKMQMLNDNEETRKAIIRVNEDTNLVHEAVLDGIHLSPLNSYEDSFEKEMNQTMNRSNTVKPMLESSNNYSKINNLNNLCKYINTPIDLCLWFKNAKIKYPDILKGNGNYDKYLMAWPDTFIKTKIGDCWDEALLYKYFCERKNINCGLGVINYFAKLKNKWLNCGHVFCIFEYNGLYYMPEGITLFSGESKKEVLDGLTNEYSKNEMHLGRRYVEDSVTVFKYYPSNDKIWNIYDFYYNKKITQKDFYQKYHRNDIINELYKQNKYIGIPSSLIEGMPIMDRSIIGDIEYNLNKFKYAFTTSIDTFKDIMAKEEYTFKLQ